MSKHTPVIEHEYPVLEHEYTTQRMKDVQDLGIESSHNQGRTTGLVPILHFLLIPISPFIKGGCKGKMKLLSEIMTGLLQREKHT